MMRSKLFRRLTSALCALALMLALVPTALAAGSPAVSTNIFRSYYQWNADCITSNLYANPNGGVTRVEKIGDEIVVEDYSASFALLSQRKLPMELPFWGAFFSGYMFNFLVFGQSNPNESDSVEVIRVVKYDKDWNRLEQASIYGANTTIPFRAGTVRCAETEGVLYIHTCHQMYKSSDGKNHQANMNIVIKESDMSVSETGCDMGYYNYVSHSFNQFILIDQDQNILTANHGDAYPRALVIHKMGGMAGGSLTMNPRGDRPKGSVQTADFRGAIGDNVTNVQLGGFAETSSGYLMAYSQREIASDPDVVKLAYISKANFNTSGGTNSLQIQELLQSKHFLFGESAPFLVPMGLSGGYIMWNSLDAASGGVYNRENLGLHWASYSADGTVGEVQTLTKAAPLSNCQPINFNGKAVWYTTNDSAPVFYCLDSTGVTATPANGSTSKVVSAEKPSTPAVNPNTTFSDVPSSHWAYQEIMGAVSLGAVAGFEDGTFHPEDTVTYPQFCLMLGRTFYPEQLAEYQEKDAGKPWYVAVCNFAWLGKIGHTPNFNHYGIKLNGGTPDNDWNGAQTVKLNRYQMAMLADDVLIFEKGITYFDNEERNAIIKTLKDYTSYSDWDEYYTDIADCLISGVMTGMPDGTFSGDQYVTRAQACAVINRLHSFLNS